MNWRLRRALKSDNENAFDDYLKQEVTSYLWLGLLAVIVAMIAGIAFSFYRVYKILSRESIYREKCGIGWREYFERDYGSLLYSHIQIAICAFSWCALIAVVIWFCRKTFPRRVHEHY